MNEESTFYGRLFDESEKGPFDVLQGLTKVGLIRKPVPGATNLYIFQYIKSSCIFCSISSIFFFVGYKVSEKN